MGILIDIAIVFIPISCIVIYKLSSEDNFKDTIIWLLIDFSGAKFIYEKIFPYTASKDNPPPTFLFWVIGVYIAFFGIASQRFENKLDVAENRANSILTQLSFSKEPQAISRISKTQNIRCPRRPLILRPSTVIQSLFLKDEPNQDIVDLLADTVVDWKSLLTGHDLRKAILIKAPLWEANMKNVHLGNAVLREATLKNADLSESYMKNANLQGANLQGAILIEVNGEKADFESSILQETEIEAALFKNSNFKKGNFENATIYDVNFENSNFESASFKNADIINVNFNRSNLNSVDFSGATIQESSFEDVRNLSVEQLCKAKSISSTNFDDQIKVGIVKNCRNIIYE